MSDFAHKYGSFILADCLFCNVSGFVNISDAPPQRCSLDKSANLSYPDWFSIFNRTHGIDQSCLLIK